jgi:hypothetical protein
MVEIISEYKISEMAYLLTGKPVETERRQEVKRQEREREKEDLAGEDDP